MDKIIHLSLTRKSVPTRIDVVQYATRPNIVFVIDDYSIPEGSTVSLYIKKPDDTEIFNYCEFEDNQVTYTPTTQSFAVLGTSKCQLQIVENDGTAVSFLIYADVTENIIDSSAIESQDEFTALEEALQTVSDYDGRITQNTNRLDNLGDEHVTFEEATTDTTISDNLTLSTIFGRIKRLFTRVKALEDTKTGDYYTGTQLTTTVPAGGATNVMSLTLPAGTYVITATMQWVEAFTNPYYLEITGLGGENINGNPIVRSTGTNGGGSVATVVVRISSQKTIYSSVSQSSGSTKTVNRLNLNAVRII